ncbi:uncharacterized protein LOC131304326 isoform X3 [Rhododendron vialii]|uniref:uncharacterized protein LOC131304326 isoform X3 n=1 Tax=Rhododendron vialii TaxID=182163 RepID=UPI00265DFC82|nr:uncharacterized protein LOC131304326 isoform X3 [Rhododendron vialii]
MCNLTKLASIQSSFVPFGITGSTCLKSPPRTTTLLPNKLSISVMSFNRLSSASILCLLAIDASSHIINEVAFNSFAKPVCLPTLQDSLPSLSSGILKRECAVRPFGKIDAATPEVAVASAILLADLMVASKARYKKVLPVPPGPSMKKEVPAFFPTAYVTWVKLSARTMHHVSQHGCIEMWIFIFIRVVEVQLKVGWLPICRV